MTSLFGTNPLTTPLGQLIEKATAPDLASENWALNLEICDYICSTEDGPKDAIKAIKKRLSTFVGKNYTVVMYVLTVLETCVKNCGRRFHLQIATKDFMQELLKIISPKHDAPQIVQEKVLSLIQTWADAFKASPELKEVSKVYQDLKHKGVEFPMTDLDAMPPIHTPVRTRSGSEPQANTTPARTASTRTQQTVPVPPPGGPLTAEQQGKLRSELDIVQTNVRILSEMLMELTPGKESPADLELLQDLHGTCQQMQRRIVELLDRVAGTGEQVTDELLRINDELNNVFLRYERYQRNKKPEQTSSPIKLPQPGASPTKTTPAVANLIDLDTPSPATQGADPFAPTSDVHLRFANIGLDNDNVSSQLSRLDNQSSHNAGTDEFDMFAQSRQSFDQNRQVTGPSAYDAQRMDQHPGGLSQAVNAKTTLSHQETDFDEMAKWLEAKTDQDEQVQEKTTSSEFDKFLEQRAKEAETLPSSGGPRPPPRGGRQLKKDGDSENTLFAL